MSIKKRGVEWEWREKRAGREQLLGQEQECGPRASGRTLAAPQCKHNSGSKGRSGMHLWWIGQRSGSEEQCARPSISGREGVSHPQEGSERDKLNRHKVSIRM